MLFFSINFCVVFTLLLIQNRDWINFAIDRSVYFSKYILPESYMRSCLREIYQCIVNSNHKTNFTFNENDPENKNTVGIRVATRNQLKAEATTWNDIYIPVNLEQIQTDDPDHETEREQKRPDFHQIQT